MDKDNIILERQQELDQRTGVFLTRPLKLALQDIARSQHISMSAVIRRVLTEATASIYPEFDQAYNEHLRRNLP